MQIVTSFSPTRLEAQHKALKSWKKYNLPIKAVQCYGEEYAKDFVDDIYWVPSNKHWSKRTPSLIDVFKVINKPSILINSDIELDLPSLDDWVPQKNTFRIGLRTDYSPKFTQLNKYGIDVFLLTPEMVASLTNSIWALGIPGWDYWIVWSLIQTGYQLEIVKEDILHAAHEEQWDKDDYRRCSKLLEFEFDIPVQDISDTIQSLTNRTHLTKRRYVEEVL